MSEFHIEFSDDDFGVDIDIADVEAETNLATLADWYSRAEELIFEIIDEVDFRRSTDRADEHWVWRAGKKIAYLKKAVRRLEQRILRLGGMPPYRLNDGRAVALRNMEKQVGQAREILLTNGLPLPWVKPAKVPARTMQGE